MYIKPQFSCQKWQSILELYMTRHTHVTRYPHRITGSLYSWAVVFLLLFSLGRSWAADKFKWPMCHILYRAKLENKIYTVWNGFKLLWVVSKVFKAAIFSIEKELLVYELSHRTKGQAFSCSNFKRSHCQHCGRVTGCVFHCTGPPIARSAYKSYGLGLGVGSLLRQCAHRYIQQLYRGLLIGRARLLYGSSGAMKFVDLKITNLFAAQ